MSKSNSLQFDPACRILTVSSSLAGSNAFINRLKVFSVQHQSPAPNTGVGNDSDDTKTSDESVVPWTILNRYYIADVHFLANVIHGISPTVFDKPHTPPAVIYVWVDGEPYTKYVEELSRLMDGYEPEVALAVRIPKSNETAGLVEDHSETQKESNTDVDTSLMSYGFEYIDATGEVPLRRFVDDGSEFPPTDDIPHLPRVLDALSTIMWPSMRSARASSGRDSESKRECDSILAELLAHDHGSMTSPASHRESEDEDDLMEQMRGLLRGGERKVKDDSDMFDFGENDTLKISTAGENIPHAQLSWLATSSKAGDSIFSPIESISLSHNDMATSPFEMDEDLAAKLTNKFSIGFEDDFTVFVSAPNNQEGETTPDAMSYHRKQRDIVESPMPSATASSTLKPWSVLERYQSLGSVSDFGGSDFGDEGPVYKSLDDSDDDLDEALPTKTEILETSAKIFGLAALQKKGTVTEDGDTHGDSDGVPPFDLSQVMSALQQFKTDISRMDDGGEA